MWNVPICPILINCIEVSLEKIHLMIFRTLSRKMIGIYKLNTEKYKEIPLFVKYTVISKFIRRGVFVRYSYCIDMMFPEIDFYKRFAWAKKCGANAIEFWKWSNKDIERVKEELARQNLAVSIFNIDSKDEKLSYDLSRGILNAGRREEFVSALQESIPVYKALNAKAMIVLIGERLETPCETQIDNIVECLKAAVLIVEKENVTLVVEPLNDIDRKNYFLPRSKEVFEILRKVNSPNIKLLLDLYHEQLMAGNLMNTMKENLLYIGHIHVADAPGRHEPGTGEIHYKRIFELLKELEYKNYVGFEFRSTIDSESLVKFMGGIQI